MFSDENDVCVPGEPDSSTGWEDSAVAEVSIKAGERVLLPAVRQAAKDTLIIADGFSCREQIAQGTDRQALHLAQVLQMALHSQDKPQLGDYPEKEFCQDGQEAGGLRHLVKTLTGVSLLAVGAGFIWQNWKDGNNENQTVK